MIPIFLSADNNYAPYLTVVIQSICENTNSSIDFYILDGGIDDSLKNIIKKQILRNKNCNIEFINVDYPNLFSDCRVRNHISKIAYSRLLIPYLKPELKKRLYLDLDLIVNIDITELFNQDIGKYIIGAVYEEYSEKYHSIVSKKNLLIDESHKYFNSGVLLINCEKWRENNITNRLKEAYINFEKRMTFHDQDLLNIVFSPNNYFQLNKKFNYSSVDDYTENKNMIFHYLGKLKPWLFLPDLKTDIINFKDIWWEYARKTECYDIFNSKCIFRDANSLRIARATKAYSKLFLMKKDN